MNQRKFKFLLSFSILITVLLAVYLAIPKSYSSNEAFEITVEAFDYYDPKNLFKDYSYDNPKLYVKNNLGWKKMSFDEPLKIAEEMRVKIIGKKSSINTIETIFDITGVDSTPPIIEVISDNIELVGSEGLQNHLEYNVLDYRYGEYDFQLNKPEINYVSLQIGQDEYTIEAQDLSGNPVSKTVKFNVLPYDIKPEEANSNEVFINKARRLASDFVPEMENVPSKYNYPFRDRDFKLRPEALAMYTSMIDTLHSETGHWALINNSYRPYDNQVSLFNRYVERDGIDAANQYSARPGHSEHQSGLTLDIRTKELDYKDFHKTEQYTWIKENAHRFGYIIRYTEDKVDITKYISEPWHLRYVGEELATYLYKNNLSLDEYYILNLK
ncbi:MAG: M15 family metallopeptidase [Erysipelothrix sp.]|nr:M15 family metallopeptidase [Erysipelothrix sp.]